MDLDFFIQSVPDIDELSQIIALLKVIKDYPEYYDILSSFDDIQKWFEGDLYNASIEVGAFKEMSKTTGVHWQSLYFANYYGIEYLTNDEQIKLTKAGEEFREKMAKEKLQSSKSEVEAEYEEDSEFEEFSQEQHH